MWAEARLTSKLSLRSLGIKLGLNFQLSFNTELRNIPENLQNTKAAIADEAI